MSWTWGQLLQMQKGAGQGGLEVRRFLAGGQERSGRKLLHVRLGTDPSGAAVDERE